MFKSDLCQVLRRREPMATGRLSKEVFLGIPKIFHVHKLSGGPSEGDWTEKSKVVPTQKVIEFPKQLGKMAVEGLKLFCSPTVITCGSFAAGDRRLELIP